MLLLSLLITKLHVFRITFHLPVFFFLLTRLGLAYAGSNRQDVLSLILPVLGDPKSNLEVRVFCFEFELDILLYIFVRYIPKHLVGRWSFCHVSSVFVLFCDQIVKYNWQHVP